MHKNHHMVMIDPARINQPQITQNFPQIFQKMGKKSLQLSIFKILYLLGSFPKQQCEVVPAWLMNAHQELKKSPRPF